MLDQQEQEGSKHLPELVARLVHRAPHAAGHPLVGRQLRLELRDVQVEHRLLHRRLDQVLHHRAEPLLETHLEIVLHNLRHLEGQTQQKW